MRNVKPKVLELEKMHTNYKYYIYILKSEMYFKYNFVTQFIIEYTKNSKSNVSNNNSFFNFFFCIFEMIYDAKYCQWCEILKK